MIVELPPELEQFVTQQVTDGAFVSVDEVVCAALHLLRQQELGHVAQTAALRADIRIGLDQLDRGEARDGLEVFARLRRRRASSRSDEPSTDP